MTFREHVSKSSGWNTERQACGREAEGPRHQRSMLMGRAAQTLFFHSEGRSNCWRIHQTLDRERAWFLLPWHFPELGVELSHLYLWGHSQSQVFGYQPAQWTLQEWKGAWWPGQWLRMKTVKGTTAWLSGGGQDCTAQWQNVLVSFSIWVCPFGCHVGSQQGVKMASRWLVKTTVPSVLCFWLGSANGNVQWGDGGLVDGMMEDAKVILPHSMPPLIWGTSLGLVVTLAVAVFLYVPPWSQLPAW